MDSFIDIKDIHTEDKKTPEYARRLSVWDRLTGLPMKRREKIVFGIILLMLLFLFYVALDANKYRATVRVIEGEGKVGVNPTTSSLDFGDLSRGTTSVRRVDIQNGTGIPMYVILWKQGRISDLMEIDKNFFTLGAHSGTKIEFTVYMPASATVGDQLDGKVTLFKIPGPWR